MNGSDTMNPYHTSQHLYYTLDSYLKQQYHSKVFKVSLSGPFSCPNRDGSIGTGGCLFCSDKASGEFAGDRQDSLKTQFEQGKALLHQKWKDAKYIVYFQANTNTYAPLPILQALFEEAILLDPNIVAISIATRPDCLPLEVLEYLALLNQKIPVWIELGLQTIHESTRKAMHIGYPLSTFDEAVWALHERGIAVIAHIINGFPQETKEDMLETARVLNRYPLQGVKIHSLYITRDSDIGKLYNEHPFPLLSLEEYVEIVACQLSLLNPDFVIHRINGDPPLKTLIAPKWATKKFIVMNEIDKYMRKNQLYQGSKKLNS